MAKPCIVKYKGKEYSVEQFSAMLHDGLLNNLIESGAIDQNKLKGDLKLLQDKGISFRYTLQEDGVSVILEGTEAINKGANAQTIRTGTRKNNNLKYIDNYSFDDVLNETYNTNSGAVSLAIKLGEGIFNYKKKNKTTGVVSKKSFVIPFLNIEAANKLKKLRKEYKKLNPPESKEEKARKAEDKRLLTKEQLKQKQAENRAKKAEEKKLLSKEEKKAIADKNAKDKKRSAKIKEELNQITKQVLVDFHKMMVLNLLAIYDTLDQNFVKLSKDWYLGANRFANAYANKYKLTVEQAAAIIAVLSPQNDWFNNLSVAERVMEIMANYSNTKMTSDIIEKAIKNQTTGEEEKNFVDVLRVAYKKFGEVSIEDLRKMGATEEIQAIYLRAFDHAFHSNKVAMTDPTGKFIGFDTTPVRWNSTSEITKAITVYRDSSMVTINDQLGGGSKVRNFYNNIVDPNSPTPYVTSDTHAAAAAMAIPMSANDAGTGFKLFDSGLNPVYAMVKQAYISAADIVGLFPREFQSITWEGTRLGINDKNRTEEKKNETFNEVSKLRENQKTNAYENARAIIAINPSGNPIWGKSRGIKTQKSTFKDSESIRSDSDKRISQVSNYGQESGRLRGDSTRVGGETTRGKAGTGEISFRFEKSGTATVKNAPKGTYLNIGLLKGETEEQISVDDVLSKLPSDVKVIKQREVTGTEPTLALQINRKMSDQEMEDFRNATAQMAIPQLSDGKGVIHGTQEWGEFNPEYFVLPNNKPLSSIKGVEITSVEPNEEEPSFRKDDEVIDLLKIKSKQELIDKLEGKKLKNSIYYKSVDTWIEDVKDEKTGNITSVTRREKSKKLIIEEGTIITKKDIDKLAQFDFDTDLYYGPNVKVRELTALEKLYLTRKVKTASAKEVLTTIANDKESKYSELAKELLEKGNSKGLAVPVKITGKRSGGVYILDTDSIEIDPYYTNNELEAVIIHEIIHGFTFKEFIKYVPLRTMFLYYQGTTLKGRTKKGNEYLIDLNKYINDDNADPHIKDLIRAYIHAVEQSGLTNKVFGNFNVKGFHSGVPYGFTNLDEFLAETFSNPEFQNMLNEIEMPGTKKTIWQTIVDAIRNILGLSVKQGSVLESALRNGAEIINKARGGVETEEGPSFRLTEDSGVSYEDTIKMAGFEDDGARTNWRNKNKVQQQQKRNPAVQKAAEEYRKGNINQAEYIQVVRENQPIRPFVMVPKIPSFKEIVGSIDENKVIRGIIGLTKDIPDGALVGLRLDIPAYEDYDIWVPTVHDGSNNKEGPPIGYAKTAVIKNVTFKTSAKRSLDIASAKLDSKGKITPKTTVARILGEWVNEDPQSVHDRAEKLMNDPAWTQIGMNPFRHSWFYDKANGNPIISADEVIQVGALVLGKNVVMGSITDEKFETQNEKGEDIYFRKDDKVKGTYFEPAMTTDSKGNYVFFHFSTAPLKSLMKGIDSRKYYSTRTSREEKGLQYGVASYYTKPTDSENVVGGDKYYVTVSPDKVYPMDLDPNGYRAAAEKKFKKNTPFRESRISKEIANAAARDGYEMAVGEWSYDRAGLTQSETPEFRGDALVPLKPQEITGKEKFKTGKERGIKTEHPDKARLAFNQQVEDLASDIDSYKSSKKKYDDGYSIANEVMTYGGIVEDYGTKNERVRPLTREEFNTMTKGLPAKLKERADKLRSQMEDNEGLSFRIDDLWHGTPHKVGKFSTSKIGTGEGAQSFGWGLYFTDLKDIADTYRRTLSEAKLLKDGVEIKEDSYAGSDAYTDGYNSREGLYIITIGLIQNFDKNKILENLESKREAIKETSWTKDVENKRLDSLDKTIEDFKNDRFTYSTGGNLYKVSLHQGKDPSQYTYLEWYKKPNKQQVENLFSKLTQKQLDKGFYYGLNPDATNADLYKGLSKALGGDKQASLFLLENGIDGIKYPAESISRGATSDTARGFNYVVFDENAVTIEDEISFRADMGQRRIASNIRLLAMLKGSAFKGLRNAINTSADTFYTKQKYAQLKPQIANMSDAELIAAIDVETSLEDIINYVDGPIVGLAFIEYINRLKNIVEDPNSTQTDIDDANDLIQSTYERVAPFTTKVAQILRQLGEIKSTIKKDEVQFYLDMIEALIEANGNMINDDHRDALRDIIQILLDSKKNHASLFSNLANKGNNVTDQDIHDLNMAEVEMQNAIAALNMLVGFLSPPSTARFWAGVLKGNLMSVRSATVGLLSNILNIGVFRYRNLVQATLSTLILPLKKLGVNTLGLEKYQFFNTPIVSNIKYALFIDVLQDAIVGLTKAIVTAGKIMIGKETRRGFLDKSPIANQVFNIIKYGSSALEGGSPVMIDQSNHIMLSIKNAFTGKGQKTRLDIRGIKMDVANSFKKANFSKWFKANYPGSDYNALSAKDKKIIQNEYFNDPSTMVPTLGDKAGGLGRAFMAFNSEFVFRLVALSDYLPKTYANNVEMTRLAQTLGLDERQTILFMKDPARYIEIVNNLLSPESLKFWTDTVAEVTVTKDTGIGMASVAIVNAIKYYVPQKLLQEFPNLKDNKWFSAVNTAWQLLIDSVVPFVKIPMNFISLVSDFLLPSKPALKVIYFFGLALKNRGTDQADAYALSAIKNVSTAVVACGIRALAVGLVSIPGMVVLAPGKDDDDEKRKMKSKFSRMSINIDALRRYFGGEDPSYKDGDKYEALTAYGLLGMVIYNYASINETADKDYYDKLNSAPRNINPEQLNLGTPFNMKNAGMLELELKAFQSSQFFIDQSWFVGVNGVLEGLTGGETGRDRFFNSFTTTLLSYWWGFSSHAQQISDIYREATGKPVFDLALPANLQDYNNPDYPGDFGDRVWNNIFKKNELVHKYLMEAPDESEYVKFGMYGEPLTPVPGITKNNTEIIMSVAGPMRTARTNLTKEERLYMAVYDNKNKINIPGKTLSLIEPTLKKSEKITVFMTDTDGEKVAKTFNAAVKPSDYNKINKMAGDALRDLHTILLSEQGLLDYEVRGKVISPEDIMSKNWGNTREVANVRNAIALTFSEGNKLLNTFLKPWEMFGSDTGKYIDKKIVATIQGVKSLVASKISEYEVLNPETGKMEMLTNYLVGHPELESKLYNLALESINLYLKLADESIEQEEEYNKLIDNPEMTIEQEKARKEGNF